MVSQVNLNKKIYQTIGTFYLAFRIISETDTIQIKLQKNTLIILNDF